MSAIQSVFERINDIEASIHVLEAERVSPLTFADELALESLRRQRADLMALLEELSDRQKIDICDYRIIPTEESEYPIKAIGETLTAFQNVFTALFAVFREGRPKSRSIFTDDILHSAELNMGYAYSGSLGLVMYSNADTFLEEETDHDLALNALIKLSGSSSREALIKASKEYGRASIVAFYNWSKIHVDNEFSVDISWNRGREVKQSKLIQPAELKAVNNIIESNPEKIDEVISTSGVLVALDIKRQTFKMSSSDSDDIRGSFDSEFDWKIPHEIPGKYNATLRKTTVRPLWSDAESVDWTLIDLSPLT